MEIVFASDHAGFELKEKLKTYIVKQGYTVIDVKSELEDGDDYPEIIRKGCLEVLEYSVPGVVFGGSGNGEAMAANKVPGIRCALVYNDETVRLARAHNNANVISIGGRMTTYEDATRWLDIFLHTPFEGGRHQDRIDDLES